MSFNTPNYRIIQKYINNQINNKQNPRDIHFDNEIINKTDFNDNILRGNMNQLQQELHDIVHQSDYLQYEDNSLKNNQREQKIKLLDYIDDRDLIQPNDGYFNDDFSSYEKNHPERFNVSEINNNDSKEIVSYEINPNGKYINIIKKINKINDIKNNIDDIIYEKKLKKLTQEEIREINKNHREINRLTEQINNSNIYHLPYETNYKENHYQNNQIKNNIFNIIIIIVIFIGTYFVFSLYFLIKNEKIYNEKTLENITQ